MSKGGVLSCCKGKTEVNFSSLMCFQSHGKQQEIRSFWHQQGYIEAIELPYERKQDGLIVTRNIEAYGWAVAGNADRQIYELPF